MLNDKIIMFMWLYSLNVCNIIIRTCGSFAAILCKFILDKLCAPNVGHRTHVSCILVKRSEVEAIFIRAARGRVLSVIQRRTGTHVGGHMNTKAQVAMLKPSQKGFVNV